MSDLRDVPAVAPMDTGADARYGFFTAGALLVLLGFGVLDLLNVLLHRLAGASGISLGVVRVYPGFGPFAQAAALFGAGAGLLGIVLLYYGYRSPTGPFVLPGTPY